MKWLQYQLEHIRDEAPWVLWAKGRRVGISESAARRRALRALGIKQHANGRIELLGAGVQQNVFSATKPQAIALLGRITKHIQLIEAAHKKKFIVGEGKEIVRLYDGTELKAFPASSRAARGEKGDVLLDEFANVMDQDALWAVAEPIASATPGNPEGYQVEVVSTPLGDDNLFHRMAEGDMSHLFSQHRVTMQDAMEQGFILVDRNTKERMTFEQFRDLKGNSDMFSQEYMCSFLAASQRYISATLWDSACWKPGEAREGASGGTYGGMDVAAGGHESAIVDLEKHGDALWQTAFAERRREKDWQAQKDWAATSMKWRRGFAIDATGIGDMFGQQMENAFPGLVESVKFTLKSKESLATGLRLRLDRKTLRPHPDDTELRRDVLSLRREITSVGNVRYVADESKHRHADGAWALALAVHAAGDAAAEPARHRRATVSAGSGIAGPRHRRGEALR